MFCYVSRNYTGIRRAGNKAKTDIEQIMAEEGFRNVGLRQTRTRKKVLSFALTLTGMLKAPFCLHRGDALVLQYPLKKYFTYMCRIAHLRGAKVIVVIHDLGSFRRKKLTAEKEIRRLNGADYIIAHNATMKNWLLTHKCTAQIGCLELFDYLSDTQAPLPDGAPSATPTVVYAGGLNRRKNEFLYRLGEVPRHYALHLYGNGFAPQPDEDTAGIDYRGFVSSDELIGTHRGDYGLVWDGTLTATCTGDFGKYLRYNNPHKASLYLRCAMPLIVWSESALAPFVREQGIGLCVSSLTEMDARLQAVTADEYAAMMQRVLTVGKQLSEGYFFRHAVRRALSQLNLLPQSPEA